jgi:hypothetical protein
MVLRLKKLADRSGSSAALHRFIGHILLSVLSGNTCVLPTLTNILQMQVKIRVKLWHYYISALLQLVSYRRIEGARRCNAPPILLYAL